MHPPVFIVGLPRAFLRIVLPTFLATTLISPEGGAETETEGWRTLEIDVTEATAADVAVAPDGRSLVFTLLGHLFRLPVSGGDAEQLTFGPHHNDDPVFSPDGETIAFISNRDGSDGKQGLRMNVSIQRRTGGLSDRPLVGGAPDQTRKGNHE